LTVTRSFITFEFMKHKSQLRNSLLFCVAIFSSTVGAQEMEPCRALPRAIQVLDRSPLCGGAPTVVLSGSWRRSFSAAFRWDDGSADGQDRSPNALGNSSAASSPYKTQRRIRRGNRDFLCYGNFLSGFPVPEQLTIKRTTAPRLDRFCVNFLD
jgi:hypothetical protein